MQRTLRYRIYKRDRGWCYRFSWHNYCHGYEVSKRKKGGPTTLLLLIVVMQTSLCLYWAVRMSTKVTTIAINVIVIVILIILIIISNNTLFHPHSHITLSIGLRGYMTKYDCSSADVNPIGGISKLDLKKFLRWAATALHYPSLRDVEQATPTAELEPLR